MVHPLGDVNENSLQSTNGNDAFSREQYWKLCGVLPTIFKIIFYLKVLL